MGEIAEMMLDGTLCQGCGEFLHDGEDGDGFPTFCAACGGDDSDEVDAEFDAIMAELDAEEVRTLEALKLAEAFIAGFEDDETQPGAAAALVAIRAAIATAEAA